MLQLFARRSLSPQQSYICPSCILRGSGAAPRASSSVAPLEKVSVSKLHEMLSQLEQESLNARRGNRRALYPSKKPKGDAIDTKASDPGLSGQDGSGDDASRASESTESPDKGLPKYLSPRLRRRLSTKSPSGSLLAPRSGKLQSGPIGVKRALGTASTKSNGQNEDAQAAPPEDPNYAEKLADPNEAYVDSHLEETESVIFAVEDPKLRDALAGRFPNASSAKQPEPRSTSSAVPKETVEQAKTVRAEPSKDVKKSRSQSPRQAARAARTRITRKEARGRSARRAAKSHEKRAATPTKGPQKAQRSKLMIEEVDAAKLSLQTLDIEQPPIRQLSYGLDRVLFNPGVYSLQDQRTGVFNFDPYLQTIMPVSEFDFSALKGFVTSSEDHVLIGLARKLGKRFIGSSSSMTGVLSHFHYLLSDWRETNVRMLSKGFPEELRSFTQMNRSAVAIMLRHNDGTYAIDGDKEFASHNILGSLGQSMEKLLTLKTDDYERYRKSNSESVGQEERQSPEAYHYSTLGNFLMRSQLDARDSRLPGSGIFDLKTRAVVSVRMDVQGYEEMKGYQIKGRYGQWESYEREYYDMIRSVFLKYSLQVRMGRMDGIFVAFHNTEQIFGFQYIPLAEMDLALHGQTDLALGDQEFKLSVDLFDKILDKATERFPDKSIRLFFETREATRTFMYIFAEPVEDEEMHTLEVSNEAQLKALQQEILGPGKSAGADDVTNWDEIHADIEEAMAIDEAGTDELAAARAESESCSSRIEDALSTTDSEAAPKDEAAEPELDAGVDHPETRRSSITPKTENTNNHIDAESERNAISRNESNQASQNDLEIGIQTDPDSWEMDHEREASSQGATQAGKDDSTNYGCLNTSPHTSTSKLIATQILWDDFVRLRRRFNAETGIAKLRRDCAVHQWEKLDIPRAISEIDRSTSGTGEKVSALMMLFRNALFGFRLSATELSSLKLPFSSELYDGGFGSHRSQTMSFIDAENTDAATDSVSKSRMPLLAMTLTVQNKVDNRCVKRPEEISYTGEPSSSTAPETNKKWSLEYSLEEVSRQERAWALYNSCKERRRKKFEQLSREDKVANFYIERLRELSKAGRKWRDEMNSKNVGQERIVFGEEEG